MHPENNKVIADFTCNKLLLLEIVQLPHGNQNNMWKLHKIRKSNMFQNWNRNLLQIKIYFSATERNEHIFSLVLSSRDKPELKILQFDHSQEISPTIHTKLMLKLIGSYSNWNVQKYGFRYIQPWKGARLQLCRMSQQPHCYINTCSLLFYICKIYSANRSTCVGWCHSLNGWIIFVVILSGF